MLLLSLLLTSIFAQAEAKVFPQGIYGDDHRRELYEVAEGNLKAMAGSSVALIDNESLVSQGNSYRLATQTYGQQFQLCPSERFFEQLAPAYCSGILVAEDLVLTAGHCVESLEACKNTKFVFGYALTADGAQPRELPTSDVFSCDEIVAREELDPLQPTQAVDYALIRLDRAAKGRLFVPMRATGGAKAGDSLTAFGYPSGLPLKFIVDAKVRNPGGNLFETNLDTYGGNSGSPVMNALTNKLEGILIRGDFDFEMTAGNCYVSKHCADDACEGEWVMKVDEILNRIEKFTH